MLWKFITLQCLFLSSVIIITLHEVKYFTETKALAGCWEDLGPFREDGRVPWVTVMTLVFSWSELRSCWRVLSKRLMGYNLFFKEITLTAELKIDFRVMRTKTGRSVKRLLEQSRSEMTEASLGVVVVRWRGLLPFWGYFEVRADRIGWWIKCEFEQQKSRGTPVRCGRMG